MQKDTVKFILSIAIYLALIFIMGLLIKPFFQPIAWACVFSIAIYPLFDLLNKIIKSEVVCATSSITILLAVIIGPSIYFISLLFNELKELIFFLKNIDRTFFVNNLLDFIEKIQFIYPIKTHADSLIKIYGPNILDALYASAQNIFYFLTMNSISLIRNFAGFLTGVFIMLVSTFFVLVDGSKIVKVMHDYLPFNQKEKDIFLSKISETVRSVFFGIIAVALAQGFLGGLGFYLLKLPSPVLWGAVMSLLAMIPFLGAPMVWFPAVIILAVKGAVLKAVLLFLWGAFIVGLIDNFLRPIIIGMKTKLHPLLVFFSVFGGLLLLGPIGLFIGPIILSLLITLAEILEWRRGDSNP